MCYPTFEMGNVKYLTLYVRLCICLPLRDFWLKETTSKLSFYDNANISAREKEAIYLVKF